MYSPSSHLEFAIYPFADMQEVTCPQCESSVTITPDAAVCSVCEADLRSLISPEAAAAYFYQRASEMATSGHRQHALTEVNRGLTYADMSELRLLGAILSKQVGDYAQMRTHVAAIPVDDALRNEGEWLLRSHQSTQNGGRAAAGSLPAALQDEDAAAATASRRQRSSWPLLLAIVILLVLAFVWFWTRPGSDGGDETAPAAAETASEAAQPEAAKPPTEEEAADIVDPAAEAAAEIDSEEAVVEDAAADESTTEEATPELSSTPEPTEAPTATPEPTPDLGANGPVDLQAFFEEQGYLGLALLELNGELVNGALLLSGEVSSANQLDAVVDVVQRVEGADAVEPDGITISPPLTYTISVGDNLWTISTFFYGDAEHMDDIFRLNREALGSPEFLPVGVVIELPRAEDE